MVRLTSEHKALPYRGSMDFHHADQYQTWCHKKFIYYQTQVLNLLPDARVEHIGSSSIPGAISKGDLDIFVGVHRDDHQNAVLTLTSLGFREKLETLRTPELCMLESDSENIALQVVANDSKFEFFLVFRDKLCSDPTLVNQYNNLKKSCEGMSHNEYRNRKSIFIEQVLSQA